MALWLASAPERVSARGVRGSRGVTTAPGDVRADVTRHLPGRRTLPPPVGDHFEAKLAGGSDAPGSDDLAVPPQCGADVAVAIEYVLLVDAEEPVAPFPVHRSRIEAGQQCCGRRGRGVIAGIVFDGIGDPEGDSGLAA